MPLKTKKEKRKRKTVRKRKRKNRQIDGAVRLMPGQDRSQSRFYSDTFRSLDSQGAGFHEKQCRAIDLFSVYLKQALEFV